MKKTITKTKKLDTASVSVLIGAQLKQKLKRVALKRKVKISNLVTDSLKMYLKKNPTQKKTKLTESRI